MQKCYVMNLKDEFKNLDEWVLWLMNEYLIDEWVPFNRESKDIGTSKRNEHDQPAADHVVIM